MPIYEYECDDCHCIFERLVFTSDEEKPACPNCHTTHVRKRMSRFGYVSSAAASGSSASSCSSSAARGFS